MDTSKQTQTSPLTEMYRSLIGGLNLLNIDEQLEITADQQGLYVTFYSKPEPYVLRDLRALGWESLGIAGPYGPWRWRFKLPTCNRCGRAMLLGANEELFARYKCPSCHKEVIQ